MKCCSRCGIAKPADLANFPPDKRLKSGLGPHCRACHCAHNFKIRVRKRGGMPRSRITAGEQYGRLIAVSPIQGRARGFWGFRCSCGKACESRASHVRSGATTSCGCVATEAATARLTKHGRTGTPEYRIWNALIRRCESETNISYRNYGGRGITVCARWRTSFVNFYADMGPRPSPKHSIDRRDTNGNYEPSNCRWATAREQGRNKRNTIFVEWRGQRSALIALCEELGANYKSAITMFRAGYPVERIFRRYAGQPV